MKKLLTLFLIAAIWSCNSVKQVLKDPEKLNKVGREWEKINPCTNDTVSISKSDTIINTDTSLLWVEKTIYDTVTNTQIQIKERFITKTIKIHDTINRFITDNRRLDIANDSTHYYKGQTSFYHGKFDAQVIETKQEKKRGNKWFWLFIAACVAGVGSHFLRSKFF